MRTVIYPDRIRMRIQSAPRTETLNYSKQFSARKNLPDSYRQGINFQIIFDDDIGNSK